MKRIVNWLARDGQTDEERDLEHLLRSGGFHWWYRLTRWQQRHAVHMIVTAGIVFLLLALIALSGGGP